MEGLPSKAFKNVIQHIQHISNIENLKNAYPYMNDRINSSIRVLLNNSELFSVNFMDYSTANKLIYASNNILFNIRTPLDFERLVSFHNITNINFYIKERLMIEVDSITYLEHFLSSVPSYDFIDRTYRIIFRVDPKGLEYAFMFSKGYFSVINSNQIRGIIEIGVKSKFLKQEWWCTVRDILKNNIPNLNLYQVFYSSSKTVVHDNSGKKVKLDLFNVETRNKLDLGRSLIFLQKIDDSKEIYEMSDFMKHILYKGKFKDLDSNIFEGINHMTKKMMGAVLYKYGADNGLIATSNDIAYFKLWKDPFVFNAFPLSRDLIKSLRDGLDKELKKMLNDLLEEEVSLVTLITVIINLVKPIDIIPFDKILDLTLPIAKKYISDVQFDNINDFIDYNISDILSSL